MNIFVGNLSFEAKEIDVERAFAAFGVVTSVAIVMEKKGKKSRGFGFVEMPDEQEAQAAIAQLHGKEILGRPINVMAALSKEPKTPPVSRRNKYSPEFTGNDQGVVRIESRGSSFRQGLPLKRTGKYKEGRRTISFIKQRLEAGITTPVSERRYKPNPMRWRKKPRWEKPFTNKPEGGFKPWQKPQTESKPWKRSGVKPSPTGKPEGEPKPWEKSRGESRTWKKADGASKPWNKSASGARPWEKTESASKPWKKAEHGSKPWEKSAGEPRPWKKTESGSESWKKPASDSKLWKKATGKPKPWRKSSVDRQQSGFKKPRRFSR